MKKKCVKEKNLIKECIMDIDKSTIINGRIDNSGNPNIVYIWNSNTPSCCFFLTVFNANFDVYISAEEIFELFPDASFVTIGVCQQEVMHNHLVIFLMNEYEKSVVCNRVEKFFRKFSDNPEVNICPVYKGVVPCINYIKSQVIEIDDSKLIDMYGFVDENCLWKLAFVGNTWWKVLVGDETVGVTSSMLKHWCECGYPPYAYSYNSFFYRHNKRSAMRGITKFYNKLHLRNTLRGNYHYPVLLKCLSVNEAGNIYSDVVLELKAIYGDTRATAPFVYDLRGKLAPFIATAFPNYMCQPGLILFASNNFLEDAIQRESIRTVLERRHIYANVEVVAIIVPVLKYKSSDFASAFPMYNELEKENGEDSNNNSQIFIDKNASQNFNDEDDEDSIISETEEEDFIGEDEEYSIIGEENFKNMLEEL